MKNQFDSMCAGWDNYLLYVPSKHLWVSPNDADWAKDVICTHLSCGSLRAFRRHLKYIAKNQPELVGAEFTLQNRCYGIAKSGQRKSYDVLMRVK